MLTVAEQEGLIRQIETNADLRGKVETLLGRSIDTMTFGEKLQAISDYMELGRSLQPFNQSARAQRDLANLAADHRGETSLADKVATLEAKNDALVQELASTKRGKS